MATHLIPLGTRFLLGVDEAEDTTEGGLHLPERARRRPQIGTILEIPHTLEWHSVRPDYGFQPVEEYKAFLGKRVLFPSYGGETIELGKETHVLIDLADIVAFVEETPPRRDPVHEDKDGWWFWDETWADREGPFVGEKEAREALADYARELEVDWEEAIDPAVISPEELQAAAPCPYPEEESAPND
jgi:co-chaperonin GroES (HSP10)